MLFTVLTWAIIARAFISWFNLPPTHPIVTLLQDVTEPILAPLRRLVPRIGLFDLTPLAAILLMQYLIVPLLHEAINRAPL